MCDVLIVCYVWVIKVHQQTDCQPAAGASDSETNDVADSSDVFQYVADSHQLPADETQLIATAAEAMSSTSGYTVFVNGNPMSMWAVWCM